MTKQVVKAISGCSGQCGLLLKLRMLIDPSWIETFAQPGRNKSLSPHYIYIIIYIYIRHTPESKNLQLHSVFLAPSPSREISSSVQYWIYHFGSFLGHLLAGYLELLALGDGIATGCLWPGFARHTTAVPTQKIFKLVYKQHQIASNSIK